MQISVSNFPTLQSFRQNKRPPDNMQLLEIAWGNIFEGRSMKSLLCAEKKS